MHINEYLKVNLKKKKKRIKILRQAQADERVKKIT